MMLVIVCYSVHFAPVVLLMKIGRDIVARRMLLMKSAGKASFTIIRDWPSNTMDLHVPPFPTEESKTDEVKPTCLYSQYVISG